MQSTKTIILDLFKKITVFILFNSILFCTFKNPALVLLYDLSPTTFTTLFCKNKTNPNIECNGQCKIKQISQEQNDEFANEIVNQFQKEVFLFYEDLIHNFNNVFKLVFSKINYSLFQQSFYHFLRFSEIEKPPTL